MRIAWLECATGISGDMTLGALIDAGVDKDAIQKAVASLNLPDVRLRIESVMKNGFRATHVLVDHPEQHAHRHYTDICNILDAADALTDRQRDIARQLFLAVAESEARVHGSTIDKVHFHEVGAVDSIVDIVGAAVGFDLLDADRIVCNFVPTGRGYVKIDHGICAVPAPGTAEILKGIPLADVPVEAELTTPTGAAIVKTLADAFGPMPAMTIDAVGYGAGTMTFPERANILRLFVGTAANDANTEHVVLLETNLDDISGEVIGHARRKLTEANALDVFTTSIQMKKDRPGVILSVLCRPPHVDTLEEIIFRETGTLGIRRSSIQRSIQHRDHVTVSTPWGEVSGKRAWRTGGSPSFAPEFEDCAAVANENGVSLRDVYGAAESAFLQSQDSGTLPVPSGSGVLLRTTTTMITPTIMTPTRTTTTLIRMITTTIITIEQRPRKFVSGPPCTSSETAKQIQSAETAPTPSTKSKRPTLWKSKSTSICLQNFKTPMAVKKTPPTTLSSLFNRTYSSTPAARLEQCGPAGIVRAA